MADDLRIDFDSRRFNSALSIWSEKSKKSTAEILEQQARLFVKEVVEITPPGKEGVKGLTARRKGDSSVESDIRRLFIPMMKSDANNEYRKFAYARDTNAIPAIHKRARNRKGRVPKRVAETRVYKSNLNAYIRQQKLKVGSLAAGWNHAAKKLGWNPPAWISRHSSPGSVEVKIDDNQLSITMKNAVSYASDQKGIQSRIYRALNKKENDMVRQVAKYLRDSSPFR